MRRYTWCSLSVLLLLVLLLAACGGTTTETTNGPTTDEQDTTAGERDTPSESGNRDNQNLSGTQVTVFGAFAEDEAARFEAAMIPFEEATGIDVVYEGSSDFETLIATRVKSGTPPDIAGFPQPGLMARFAEEVVDITEIIPRKTLEDRYVQSWLDMATTEDGKMLGVWHRVTVKSLVWYPPEPFQEAGYEVPQNWDELIALSDQMVADGTPPWSAPMESQVATGWVGTDWIEDIMLRTTSLENYDKWVRGELPFRSPEVRNAFELMGQVLLNEEYVYGGKTAMLTTSFFDSGKLLLEQPPDAWMVRQGNAMAGWLDPVPEVGPASQLHYFYFPPIDEQYGRPVLVAGDVYGVFDNRPEVRALVEYLTTAQSLEAWIKEGGILSPHKDVDMDWYPLSDRGVAEILARASAVRFDGSDLMPAEVGTGTFWAGVVNYIDGEDLDTVLQTIDESWPE